MGTGGIRLDGGDGVSSHLQIIAELEALVEMQARTVRVLATRLAELGDTEASRIAAFRRAIGGDEWPE